MANGRPLRALIVGGGVGGLAAGIALRRAGLDVCVLERAAAPRPGGGGLWLWPNGLAALDELGVLPAVRAAGRVHTGSWIRSRRGRALAFLGATDAHRRPLESLAIHRPALLAALAEALGAESLRLAATVVALEAGDDPGVRLADGAVERADVVIGADGIGSVVRAALHGPAEPRDAGFTAWRAVVEWPEGPRESVTYWGRGTRFGLIPLGRGQVNWFAALDAPPMAGTGAAEVLARRFADFPAAVREALDRTPPEGIRADRVLVLPPLAAWGRGRVTLVGDAAHPMTPSLGQGACQAFEDAAALGRLLAGSGDVAAALLEYEGLRRPRAERVVARSRRMDALLRSPSAPLQMARDAVVAALPAAVLARVTAPFRPCPSLGS